MSEHERRRHHRFALRLTIQLRRGDELLSADVINASQGGCLALVKTPLAPGEVLAASIPELMVPETRLRVLRCQADPIGYTVAMRFEPPDGDPLSVGGLSDVQGAAGSHKFWPS